MKKHLIFSALVGFTCFAPTSQAKQLMIGPEVMEAYSDYLSDEHADWRSEQLKKGIDPTPQSVHIILQTLPMVLEAIGSLQRDSGITTEPVGMKIHKAIIKAMPRPSTKLSHNTKKARRAGRSRRRRA